MTRTRVLIVAVLLLAAGAYFFYTQVLTLAYPVRLPPEIRTALLARLDAEDVWYREEDTETLRFLRSDAQRIQDLGDAVTQEILPDGRSFAPVPGQLPGVEARLREKGILYRTTAIGGSVWIILDPQYSGRVEEVLLDNR
ncbi:MAG: hypothetical protein H6953_09700 [Chromatiaceae bacterium]|nr:hypothetical protein [Chromatiaceae bacterium]MCP5312568.1 hypothetical protein [Chromatiaceae bacterium]